MHEYLAKIVEDRLGLTTPMEDICSSELPLKTLSLYMQAIVMLIQVIIIRLDIMMKVFYQRKIMKKKEIMDMET